VYAIIEDSGTQIKVTAGDTVELDIREHDEGDSIVFDRVLAMGSDTEGDDARIGTPYVDGATVTGEIIEAFKGEKIHVIKYKRRKGYRRKTGHRQQLLKVKITSIDG
jgi:large subunit ribosomal protein L21